MAEMGNLCKILVANVGTLLPDYTAKYIPEDNYLHTRRLVNLKSPFVFYYLYSVAQIILHRITG
jgi:hypothetical protein